MPRIHRPARSLPVQGKRGAGDAPGLEKYSCSACRIDYQVHEGRKALCPLCEAREEIATLRQHLDSMSQQTMILESDLERARNESSMIDAMRQALSLAESGDVAEIKAIAYRWRSEPQRIVVQCCMSPDDGSRWALKVRERNRPSGATEVFVPQSVGGVAFVETFRDLMRARGSVKAMEGYSQAIADNLAPDRSESFGEAPLVQHQ